MQELIEVITYIRSNNFDINPNLNNAELVKFFTNKNYVINPFQCNHINKTIEISSNWDVYVCRSDVFWNIYDNKMYEILPGYARKSFLNDIKEEQQSDIWLHDPRCNRCCYQKSPTHNHPKW